MSFPSLHVRQRTPTSAIKERAGLRSIYRGIPSPNGIDECESRRPRTSEKYGDAFLVCASHMHTHRHTKKDCRIRLCT